MKRKTIQQFIQILTELCPKKRVITKLNMREEVLLMDQDSLDERWRMIAMSEARPLSGLISDSNF